MADDPVKKPEEEHTNPKVDDLLSYAKNNTVDTLAYVLLITGLVLMFFQSFLGSILVGAVVGYFFSDEIATILRSYNYYVQKQGIVKTLILGGLLLAIFIALPLLVISAVVVVGMKQLIFPKNGNSEHL